MKLTLKNLMDVDEKFRNTNGCGCTIFLSEAQVEYLKSEKGCI